VNKLAWAALLLSVVFVAPSLAADPSQWGPISSNSAPMAWPSSSPVPASINGAASPPANSWVSGCVPSLFARSFDISAALAGAATLQAQRYADAKCTIPTGSEVPSTALALTTGGGCPGSTYCGDVGLNDTIPFAAFVATLTDTSGAANAVTNVFLLQGAE